MDVLGTLKDADLEEAAQRALHGARELALEKAVPASTDRLRDLAERMQLDKYRGQVQQLERDFAKRASKLEHKLERRAKHLPVDTPFDRRRRRRVRRRSATTAGAIAAVAAAGTVAYLIWRAGRSDERASLDRDARSVPDGDGAPDTSESSRLEASSAAEAHHSAN